MLMTKLVRSSPSPSKANDLGSGRIRILILIIRIHGFTNYSDLFRIGSEPDSIPSVRDKILKCDERKHGNTDGTSDIGDYVNSRLD